MLQAEPILNIDSESPNILMLIFSGEPFFIQVGGKNNDNVYVANIGIETVLER